MSVNVEIAEIVVNAALEAGRAIMKIYDSADFGIEMKADKSPLTKADKNANDIIVHYLSQTGIDILSEEGHIANYEERKNWTKYWCIDPLDGTKEFIKKNGEFTVNIALMEGGKPTFGVIYVPVTDELYVGGVGSPAKKIGKGVATQLPHSLNKSLESIKTMRGTMVVVSRSHLDSTTEKFLSECNEPNTLSMGSSLKFMAIADGSAQMYPRFAPCMEWDTAAAHAILNSLGYAIHQLDGQLELEYNKQNLLNPDFICY